MKRKITGLKWARGLEAKPASIPVGRARGAKRHGVKYERDFAKTLGAGAWHGKWFEFCDQNGKGFCQPDFLMRVGDSIVVLETKYSYVVDARVHFIQLYKPVVEAAFGAKAVGITVVKNLVPGMVNCRITADLAEAIRWALTRDGREIVLHWLAGPAFIGARPGHVELGAEAALASL
jgi:hypothetical protein